MRIHLCIFNKQLDIETLRIISLLCTFLMTHKQRRYLNLVPSGQLFDKPLSIYKSWNSPFENQCNFKNTKSFWYQ